MKADVSNYDANIAKARKTLDGFKQDNLTMGGILNQSTKSIVAAAAQYASFAAVIGTVASGFADAASRGMEMSRETEGVSKAFERLNQPGLLDNLREATHGTVNDLELMKQAVKFDNFNLSLEQMGTFLAFAQQQAKDTGQDVNYLVDSIVTGLGRKSLPILDNLGLSAEEIKKRMAETGDMTTAVAQIIEERMKDAGDYVETAADRAAQAQARLDNAMKELGDTMNSLSGAGATLWTDLKVGAINFLNEALLPILAAYNSLAEYASDPKSWEDSLPNTPETKRAKLGDTAPYTAPGGYVEVKDAHTGKVISGRHFDDLNDKNAIKDWQGKLFKSGGGSKNLPDIGDFNKQSAKSLLDTESLKSGADALSPYQMMLPEIKKNILDIKDADLGGALAKLGDDEVRKEIENMIKSLEQEKMAFSLAGQAAENFGAALAGMDDPATKAAGTVISAIANIALGFATASAQAGALGPFGWIAWLAAGTAALATTISTVHSLTGYANGGVVQGNTFSGDQIPAMLNAGEVVLNRAEVAGLAGSLQNNGISNLQLEAVVTGEDLRFILNSNGRRTGRGEIVTSHIFR